MKCKAKEPTENTITMNSKAMFSGKNPKGYTRAQAFNTLINRILGIAVILSIYTLSIEEFKAQSCSGTTNLTSSTGSFTDGSGTNDYDNGLDCKWLIQPSGATTITLSFSSFDTELNFDEVKVYDGSTTSATLLGTFSGTSVPSSLTSTGGSMLIHFTSDPSLPAAGWSASYTSTGPAPSCGGTTTLTSSTGSFDDGSGSGNYGSNSDCKWLIQPSGATSITLSFSAFDTESNFDKVEIYDGTTTSATQLATYSGSSIPASVTTTGGNMLIHFTSDNSVDKQGFSASYSSASGSPPACSGTTTLTTSSASFDDGSGSSNYGSNSDCKWLIQPSGATSITLSFSAFDTESNFDKVEIYDGTTTSATQLATYSGSSIPASVTSTGGDMLVHFTSDNSVNKQGFSASYTSSTTTPPSCSGTTTFTASSGTFDDGSGSGNCGSNSDCKWLIQPNGATAVTLSFSAFDTESNFDKVQVYDGVTTSDPLLGTFSGSTIPSNVTSSTANMLVHFTSDGSVNKQGFSSSYTSTSVQAPVAEFSASPTSITAGQSVNFSDLSTNGPTAWLWTFNGAATATSSVQDPTGIIYNTPGCYQVSLLVSNLGGSDTETKTCYINVAATPYCTGTTTLTSSTGSFDDGSGSNDYASNSDCKWLIQPSGAAAVTLSFSTFDTESNYDFVKIYDGSTTSSSLLASYSGNTVPLSVTSTGGIMLVHFTSDGSLNKAGWSASYTSATSTPAPVADFVANVTNITAGGSVDFTDLSTNSPTSWSWSFTGASTTSSTSQNPVSITWNTAGCYDVSLTATNAGGSDSETKTCYINVTATSSYCSGTTTLTSASGSFNDGSGTSDYNSNSDCKWLIQPTNANSITLGFTAFDTENNYDFVKVYDGTTTSATLLGTFSGSTVPGNVTSTGGDMLVHFTSDGSLNKAGWDANYTSTTASGYCSGTTTLTASSGSFDDGSGVNNYGNNADCKWLVQPTGAASVMLSFSAFDLIGQDAVTVYDGATTTANILGTFTGSTLPSSVASTQGIMLVHFTSNASSTDPGWAASYTSASTTSFCSGTTTLTASSGSFADGSASVNYAANSDCKWLIQPSGATSISLSFSAFDTESNYDLVKVYDGSTTSATQLGSFSGSTLPSSVTSNGGTMLVHFTSDGSVNKAGWDASYTSASGTAASCIGTANLTAPSGFFDDGSGSGDYGDNSDCKWLIQPSGATSVTLSFSAFATENNFDFVKVYDGSTTTATLLGSFSGTTVPSSITSTGGTLLVHFTSDGSTGASGWAASYTSTSGSVNGCSGSTTFLAATGSFSDGSGTSNYGNNGQCDWLIQPVGATSITLDFNSFDTEFNYDYVKVYDGPNTSSTLMAAYSGSSIPASLTSTGGSMLVEFVTNGSNTAGGWDATYSSTSNPPACSGTTTLMQSFGFLTDGSGSNDYANNLNCNWLIQPAAADTIWLTITSLFTEFNADYLKVYDGTSAGAPLIGVLSGLAVMHTVYGTSGAIYVQFTTNSSVTSAGWSAFYTSSSGGGTSGTPCSGTSTLTTASGTFSDGSGSNDYGDNADCQWLIQPVGATAITLNFTAFATEQNFDFVKVYDGNTTTDSLLGSYSGSSLPSSVVSTGGAMLVHFTSDGSTVATGWDANYTSSTSGSGGSTNCSGTTTLTTPSGSFSDGSATADYGNNADCRWLIQPAGATTITLTFSAFDTEQNYDKVWVYDGAATTDSLLGEYSGSTVPATLTSTGGEMLVHFTSDGSIVKDGWDASYTSTSGGGSGGTSSCTGTTTLTASTGSFSDGSGTADYGNNADCKWLIQPSGASSMTLTFTAFDTENNYDSVTVYDGSTVSATILGSFSGSSLPVAISSTGGNMLVHFTSDGSLVKDGWDASYTTSTGGGGSTTYCSGLTNLTAPSGTFSDGSSSNEYNNDSDCQWLIQPTNANSITLNFASFATENNYDIVRVYDGATTSDTLMGEFSGSSQPTSVTSTGGSMLVHFTSDASVTVQGWDASYTSNSTGGGGTATAPVTDFTATATTVEVGQTVDFIDLSANAPTNWTWVFTNGSPSSSTAQNPVGVTYSTPGCFDVTLVASNSAGTNTETKTCYVNVTAPVGMEELENEPTLSVIPNPNNGNFKVRVNQNESLLTELTIVNALGETIYTEQLPVGPGNHLKEFHLDELPNGLYFVTLVSNGTTVNERVLIQR